MLVPFVGRLGTGGAGGGPGVKVVGQPMELSLRAVGETAGR